MTWRYRYPRRPFPYERARRRQRAARPRQARVRAARYGGLRGRPVLVRHGRLREGRPARRVRRRPGREPGVRHRDAARAARGIWFRNTWAWGVPGDEAVPVITPWDGAPKGATGLVAERPAGTARLLSGRRPGGPVLRQRDEHRAAVGGARPVGVPEGRDRRPRRARCADGQPRAARYEGGPAPRAHGAGGRRPRDPAAADPGRPGRGHRHGRGRRSARPRPRPGRGDPPGRGRRLLRRVDSARGRATTRRACCGRRWRG